MIVATIVMAIIMMKMKLMMMKKKKMMMLEKRVPLRATTLSDSTHTHHHDHKRVVLVDHALGVRHKRVECLGEDSVTNTRAASGLDPHGRRLERLSELQGLDDVIINASASNDT